MQNRSRLLVLVVLILALGTASLSAVGVTFSYFVPRHGWFSHPVSPLSVQDLGLTLGRYFGLAGSLSLYTVSGMGLTDAEGTPFELDSPAVGPFASILGTLVGKVILPIKIGGMVRLEIVGRGGMFGCFNLDPPLITGALERYLAGSTYEALTASLTSDGRWGWGWVFGGGATWYLTTQLGMTLTALYYLGGADLHLSGSYDAYDSAGAGTFVNAAPLPARLRSARLDFSGLELQIGVSFRL
jgi:hypothetical protein